MTQPVVEALKFFQGPDAERDLVEPGPLGVVRQARRQDQLVMFPAIPGQEHDRVPCSRDAAIRLDQAEDALVKLGLGVEVSDVEPEVAQACSRCGGRRQR